MYSETTDIFRRVSEQQLELLSENFSRFSNQLKRLSSLKKPEDFINLQRDIISENITASVDTMQKSMQILLGNMEAFTKTYNNASQKNNSSSKMTMEKSER